jgi:hypothetical protein
LSMRSDLRGVFARHARRVSRCVPAIALGSRAPGV